MLAHIKPIALRIKRGDILPVDKPVEYESIRLHKEANVFVQEGDFERAKKIFGEALKKNPMNVDAIVGLGYVLSKLGLLDEAFDALMLANDLTGGDPGAYYMLGELLQMKNDPQNAVRFFANAVEMNPNYVPAIHNQISCMHYSTEYNAEDCLNVARKFDKAITKRINPCSGWAASENKDKTKITLGFVSGNLNNHPNSYFLENALKELDRSKFQLIAYSTSQEEDAVSKHLKRYFNTWIPLGGAGIMDLAARIYQDEVDILIDLCGHNENNALEVFAYKPAPIQVSWLGYPGTTGLRTMDYILADRISIQPSEQRYFTERVVYLPKTRLSFIPPELVDDDYPTDLPAKKKGYITFGSYQKMSKINVSVIVLWVEILKAIPNSKLRLQPNQILNESFKEEFIRKFTDLGIERERIELYSMSPREEYLKTYSEVDIVLDTFPFNGLATTCEAMWMGVPVLTLKGNTMASRQGAMLVSSAGLKDWIVENKDDYVKKAIEFSNNLEELESLRFDLRLKMFDSPITNAEVFARNLENALLYIYKNHKN